MKRFNSAAPFPGTEESRLQPDSTCPISALCFNLGCLVPGTEEPQRKGMRSATAIGFNSAAPFPGRKSPSPERSSSRRCLRFNSAAPVPTEESPRNCCGMEAELAASRWLPCSSDGNERRLADLAPRAGS